MATPIATTTRSSLHSPTNLARFSSLYLSPTRISPANVLLKTRSPSLLTTNATRLASSPSPEGRQFPAELSGKVFRFSGWTQQIRLRSSVQIPVVKAAAADAEGSELRIPSLFFEIFCSLFLFGY